MGVAWMWKVVEALDEDQDKDEDEGEGGKERKGVVRAGVCEDGWGVLRAWRRRGDGFSGV